MRPAQLEGKTALVTGASGDLGIAVVEKLLGLGCTVFAVHQRNRATLDALLERIGEHTPKLDILINNAGICRDNVFPQMTLEEFDQVIKISLYGTFHVTQASLRLLRAAKAASVINLASVAGLVGCLGQANYSAAKAAIGGLTRTLAIELTHKGIRVNAVAPGLIDTAMVKRVPRNIIRQAVSMIPARRLGTTDEVANVVAFLAGDDARYIVGQTIVVDGGLVLR